jgi:deoxyadenosine/deoxycytidine kinase
MSGDANMRLPHVVVEGPIGAGKTTLARALAAHWGARAVLEQPNENPYLERFYQHMGALGAARGNPLALQTQLSFLFQRVEQLKELGQPSMFEHGVVSDFMFAKDAIFAMLTLGDEDLALYRQIYRRHSAQASEPDLVIWLQAEPDTLLARVRQRGLVMERSIGEDYLRAVSTAYHRYFAGHRGAPVLAVNTEAFHPADDSSDFARLLARIADFKGPFEFYDPPDRPDRAPAVGPKR